MVLLRFKNLTHSLTLVALREHDDGLDAVMANHPPKVVHGPREGALRRDELPTPAATLKEGERRKSLHSVWFIRNN